MADGYEDHNDNLHERCAVDRDRAGTELLIVKSWTGSKYVGRES
ncbi:MAG: hypothetical protein ACJ71K_12035 [Nitrososphaeraceae archaeon]